jgi:hypothetical protein
MYWSGGRIKLSCQIAVLARTRKEKPALQVSPSVSI